MELRESLGCDGEDTLLLSVGELSDRKNHKVVIEALSEMECSRVKYVIAGQGGLENKLTELIAEKNLENTVQLLGYRSDVNELCRAADVFVFPSLQEGLPVALMEAMASGLPCVVSRIRGNIDLIDKHGGGLFDPHSVEECCTAITKIMNSDFDEMGIYNRNKMKHFDKKVVLDGMRSIYEKCTVWEN